MSTNEGGLSCAQGCWLLAVGAGVVAIALLMVVGDWRLIQALFAFVVIAVVLGALLQWVLCKPLSAPGEPPLRNTSENPTPTSKQSAAAAAAAAREGAKPGPATSAVAAAGAETSGGKPAQASAGGAGSTAPAADRKQEGGDATAATKPAPAAPVDVAGDAPTRLSAARASGPDDLKLIKGIGPKLETLLNSMGFFHFDQIAAWSDKEVAWVDANLEGFKGRVSRDDWVAQAKTLAAGGSTEFSKKAKKGDG